MEGQRHRTKGWDRIAYTPSPILDPPSHLLSRISSPGSSSRPPTSGQLSVTNTTISSSYSSAGKKGAVLSANGDPLRQVLPPPNPYLPFQAMETAKKEKNARRMRKIGEEEEEGNKKGSALAATSYNYVPLSTSLERLTATNRITQKRFFFNRLRRQKPQVSDDHQMKPGNYLENPDGEYNAGEKVTKDPEIEASANKSSPSHHSSIEYTPSMNDTPNNATSPSLSSAFSKTQQRFQELYYRRNQLLQDLGQLVRRVQRGEFYNAEPLNLPEETSGTLFQSTTVYHSPTKGATSFSNDAGGGLGMSGSYGFFSSALTNSLSLSHGNNISTSFRRNTIYGPVPVKTSADISAGELFQRSHRDSPTATEVIRPKSEHSKRRGIPPDKTIPRMSYNQKRKRLLDLPQSVKDEFDQLTRLKKEGKVDSDGDTISDKEYEGMNSEEEVEARNEKFESVVSQSPCPILYFILHSILDSLRLVTIQLVRIYVDAVPAHYRLDPSVDPIYGPEIVHKWPMQVHDTIAPCPEILFCIPFSVNGNLFLLPNAVLSEAKQRHLPRKKAPQWLQDLEEDGGVRFESSIVESTDEEGRTILAEGEGSKKRRHVKINIEEPTASNVITDNHPQHQKVPAGFSHGSAKKKGKRKKGKSEKLPRLNSYSKIEGSMMKEPKEILEMAKKEALFLLKELQMLSQ